MRVASSAPGDVSLPPAAPVNPSSNGESSMTAGMTPDDLMWLAGLAEGESAIDLQRGRYPRIRISMTDRDVIGRAASLIGATVRLSYSREHKPMFHTEKQGPRAVEVLEALLPHMGARRSQQIATVLSRHYYLRSADESPSRASGFTLPRPPGLGDPLSVLTSA